MLLSKRHPCLSSPSRVRDGKTHDSATWSPLMCHLAVPAMSHLSVGLCPVLTGSGDAHSHCHLGTEVRVASGTVPLLPWSTRRLSCLEVASAPLRGGSHHVWSPGDEATLLQPKLWLLERDCRPGEGMLWAHRLLYQCGIWGFLDGHSPRSFVNIIKARSYLVLIQSLQRDWLQAALLGHYFRLGLDGGV